MLMFNRIFKVTCWHLLGISIFCIFMKSSDMIFGTTIINFLFETTNGVWTLNGVGIITVSIAVWDGQFVNMVKKHHWSQREKLPSNEIN